MTVLEVAISGSIMGVLLLAATQVAGGALDATAEAVRESSQTASVTRSADELIEVLGPAGSSTLWGTPLGGQVDEFMSDGLVYDRITFRTPVAYVDGVVLYEPAEDEEPDALWFQADGGGVSDVQTWGKEWGSLILLQGDRKEVLRAPVRDVKFVRDGQVLHLSFVSLRDDEKKEVSVERTLHLQAR